MVAGIGCGVLLSTVAGILVFLSQGPEGRKLGVLLFLTILATFLAMFPGNMLAAVPTTIELEPGKRLRLHAPLKKLDIPIEEVEEVRDSTGWQIIQQGTIVKLSKRHGLMKSFAIHWAFGTEGRELVRALKEEISQRAV